ncbi:hypothetical protein CcI6DRAFT_00670 [Frankia sp. CcI6]|nr:MULTISPECIES: hypothetical protein [Frankia]ETA03834.1 hypothetical protein CcI6DRAFT_00670 [Frankia sp. CcI6]OAA26238.1 hypothetical protein AAY23_103211 [Frankia casuarinae]
MPSGAWLCRVTASPVPVPVPVDAQPPPDRGALLASLVAALA